MFKAEDLENLEVKPPILKKIKNNESNKENSK